MNRREVLKAAVSALPAAAAALQCEGKVEATVVTDTARCLILSTSLHVGEVSFAPQDLRDALDANGLKGLPFIVLCGLQVAVVEGEDAKELMRRNKVY